MHVKFIPSFFMTHRYAGQGTIEIADDSLKVSGRRIWSLGKRLAVTIPIFVLLLFAKFILGLVGILLLWTLVCRSRITDTIALSRISDVRKLRGRRAQFRVAAANAEGEAKVVFEGDEVDLLIQELQTRMTRVGAASLIPDFTNNESHNKR